MTSPKNNIIQKLNKPVVLVGLMAAGKTELGKLLAERLELDFFDSDAVIEDKAQKSIPDIFAEDGESTFREWEYKVLSHLISDKVCVIATGGGAVITPKIADLIWNQSLSIWLKTDIATHLKRIQNPETRPMLKTEQTPEQSLQVLMDKRYPVYEKAHIHLHIPDEPPEKSLSRITQALYDYYND